MHRGHSTSAAVVDVDFMGGGGGDGCGGLEAPHCRCPAGLWLGCSGRVSAIADAAAVVVVADVGDVVGWTLVADVDGGAGVVCHGVLAQRVHRTR